MVSLRMAALVVLLVAGCTQGRPKKRKHYVETPPPSNDGQGGDPCRGGVMLRGQCYDFNSKKVSWDRARKFCTKKAHGDLPLIRKKPVYDVIMKYAKDKKVKAVMWVGLSESKLPGDLVWVSDDILENRGRWNVYTQWDPSSPKKTGEKGKKGGCVGLSFETGKFKLYSCKEKHLPVCELNFEKDEKVIEKINERIDRYNERIEKSEEGALGTLMEANQGVVNLYDTDIKLDEEQKELIDLGADPSSATKDIKIKPGKKPTYEQLEKAYRKNEEDKKREKFKPNREEKEERREEGRKGGQGKSRTKRAAREGDQYRWPEGVVPYEFHSGVSTEDRATILKALSIYKEKTCVKLTPRTTEKDYLLIQTHLTGCWSWVGRQGSMQEVNLSGRCLLKNGTIQHEFLHAFGFWHEHTRPDRDNYVTVDFENVDPTYKNNFNKQPKSLTNGHLYDYGSIMHYPDWAFAVDSSKPTIKALKQTDKVIGQREQISDLDLAELSFLYSCHKARAAAASSVWKFIEDKTSGGNGNNAPCVFPSTINGVQQNACLDFSGGIKWCATTANYDVDKKWGECAYHKDITTYIGSGNANGAHCTFPFTYGGKEFHFCTLTAASKPWCGTTPNYDTDKKYGHCVLVPMDGGWNDWSEWGSCSKTCGGGQQSRKRVCNNPAPANGGKNCDGSDIEQRACGSDPCPKSEMKFEWIGCWDDKGLPELMNTVEGTAPATGDYTKRADKKGTCATAAQAQGCKIFAIRFDGKCYGQTPQEWSELYQGNGASDDCPESGYGSTDALDAYTLDVNAPIHGQWGVWGTYGTCSKTCGGGTHTRTRPCTNPAPKNGGNACPGSASESKACATNSCPVNGQYDAWTAWSSDVQSDATTGEKYRYRTRQCSNPPPSQGGSQCEGVALDVEPVA